MTVKELLSRNHVTFTEIPEDLVNVPLRIFVDMWNKMDPDFKSKLESVAYICQRRIEQDERGSSPLQSTPNEPEATNDSPVEKPVCNWRAENGAKRKLPVKTDDELTQEHMARMRQQVKDWNNPILSWLLREHKDIIDIEGDGWTKNSYTRLTKNWLDDGFATFKEVLELAPGIVKSKSHPTSPLVNVLDIWQTKIIYYLNANPSCDVKAKMDEQYSLQEKLQQFNINEHPCAILSIEEYVNMHLYEFDLSSPSDPRLLGCKTISDVFALSDLYIERQLSQIKRQEDAKKLRDHIKRDIVCQHDKYDEASNCLELPYGLPETASVYDQIRTAIIQQCEYLEEHGKGRNAQVVRDFFILNYTASQILKKLNHPKGLTTQRVYQIIADYVECFLSGPSKPLCLRYISQSLVDQIDSISISSKYLYKSAKEFWMEVAPEKSEEREADNIVKTFFEIDFATPSAKDEAKFWDANTCICIREGDKAKFKSDVLMPIYDFLNEKIEPTDIEQIQRYIFKSGHEVALDIEYLKSVLNNYSKVTSVTEDTYQLTIDAYTKATYKCARYVYDHREENREFLHEELEEILHIGKTKTVPSNLDETLRQIVTLKEGKWKYGSYNADVPYVPIRALVAQYAEEKEIFLLEDLCKDIKPNYKREQPALNTIYGYATRYCTVSSENNQLFCYNKAIDKHPEFKRRERKEIGTINNYVLQQIHNILIENPKGLKVEEFRKKITVPKDESKAYYVSRIESLVRKFSSDESFPSGTPFLYRKKGENVLIVLSKNHEDFDWKDIGKAQTVRYKDVVIDRAVQFLRRQKDYKCSRLDLYRECMPLFETINPRTAATIFYDIIYHHLDDTISSERKDGDFYLWLNPEQISKIASEVVVDEEIKEDNYTLPERKPYPYGTRPTPDRNNFKERLVQYVKYTNMKSGLNLNNEDIEKASQYLTEMLFENEDIQIYNDILCDWYEYLNYQIDLRSARSIYTSSLNAYEKYLRELYGIEPSYYNRIAGLADTIANIPDLCEEFGYEQIKRNYNRTPIQTFYNSFWLDRNNLDHGDNLRYDEKFVYKNIRQAIVLYVYAYLRREQLV